MAIAEVFVAVALAPIARDFLLAATASSPIETAAS